MSGANSTGGTRRLPGALIGPDVVTSDLEKIVALVDRMRVESRPVQRELIARDVVRAVARFQAQHGEDPIELILEATS